MTHLLWTLEQVLVRQPLMGTGKCIERYVDAGLWLPARPTAGDTLRLRASAHCPLIRIKVDSVEMDAAYSRDGSDRIALRRDIPAGEIISSSMILLPMNESPDDPEMEFYRALQAMSAKRSPIKPEEIKPIHFERWLLDGCIANEPEEQWFDGMIDGEGYSQEFILTREGRSQFESAKWEFLEHRRRQMRED